MISDGPPKTHNILDEVFQINLGYYYNAAPGYFGYLVPIANDERPKTMYWHSCREEWVRTRNVNFGNFLYNFAYNNQNNPTSFAEYIYKFEIAAKLPHISFQRINTKNGKRPYLYDETLLWCNVPQFWNQPMRQSLLTAIFRTASLKPSHITELDEGFNHDLYTKETIPAIHHFIKGYNYYTGEGDGCVYGWHERFKDRPNNFYDLTKTT